MSLIKNSPFHTEYTVVEVIKSNKHKKTSIVRDNKGFYYIAKKLLLRDKRVVKQISVMKNLKHPNIVACLNIIQQKDYVYLIEDYCEEGDLAFHVKRQLRKKREYFQEKVIAKWMLQLLLAIQYLHDKKIIHRDIRPQNIFLTSEGNIKLGSFSSSKVLSSDKDLAVTLISSPYYMAPECGQKNSYNERVDIWAFGCVLYEVSSLTTIFNQKNKAEVEKKIMKGQCSQLPKGYSKQLNSILQKCLNKVPQERPSAKDLLRTPYFLEAIQSLITNFNPIGVSRIPIKRYKIHIQNLQEAKMFRKYSSQEKQRSGKKQSKEKIALLPRIGQAQTDKINKKTSFEKLRAKSREIPRCRFDKNKSQQIFQKQPLVVKPPQSRQKDRAKKSEGLNQSKKPESNIRKSAEKSSRNSRDKERKSSIQKKQKVVLKIPKPQKTKTERLQTQNQQFHSPIKTNKQQSKLIPPPMLPKPVKKSEIKDKLDFTETLDEKKLSLELESFRSKDNSSSGKKKTNYAEEGEKVKANLQKLFFDLGIKEEEEQELSFQLEDQNLARLTGKSNDHKQLIKTYKTKLEQLIQQINYKYCPDMETIQERTQQFDSNTFQQMRKS